MFAHKHRSQTMLSLKYMTKGISRASTYFVGILLVDVILESHRAIFGEILRGDLDKIGDRSL